jgi:hypothetical protein
MHRATLATLLLAAIGDVTLPAPGRGEWRPLTFRGVPRATAYEPVTADGVAAIRAASDCSASALSLPVDRTVDLGDTPRLTWRWRSNPARSPTNGTANEPGAVGTDFPGT